MNDVPLLFAETVARFVDDESLQNLKDSYSGLFRHVGRSVWDNRLLIFLNVVYNSPAKTFEYCLTCRRLNGKSDYGPEEPYTNDPADHRFVRLFGMTLYSDRNSLHIRKVTWTSATPSDPTLLKLLRAPFARTSLCLYTNCPEFLKMLPGYCTFYRIFTNNAYNDAFDAIIERSQECGRLEEVHCKEFFTKRGREASTNWILTNKRLRWIFYRRVDTPTAIERALHSIGVQ